MQLGRTTLVGSWIYQLPATHGYLSATHGYLPVLGVDFTSNECMWSWNDELDTKKEEKTVSLASFFTKNNERGTNLAVPKNF